MKFKKSLSAMMAAAVVAGVSVTPAFALEYNYTTGGDNGFYPSTSATADAIANSGKIVVGSDGTIQNNTSGNVTSGPLSSFELPVGEYPDSWGKETDIAIAQNSIFPNVLAPTTQMTNVHAPVQYDTGRINSSALPTPNQQSYYVGSTNGGATYYYANGALNGVPTKEAPMQAIDSDGAIGSLSIPSIGVNEKIYDGTSVDNMKKGLAHFNETAGWEGNIGLAGHNRGSYGVFQNISKLKVGDTMTYTTAYGTKTYKVVSIGTCSTTDTSGLVQDGTNKITMYTCVANRPDIKRKVVAVQV